MSNYRMYLRDEISLGNYSTIHDYLNIVSSNDDFIIEMSNMSEDDYKLVCAILESSKFDIITRGESGYGAYSIRTARRK